MDQNNILIERLEQYSQKMESMGDAAVSARVRVDTKKLQDWLDGGQNGVCPVELSQYEGALDGLRPVSGDAPVKALPVVGITETQVDEERTKVESDIDAIVETQLAGLEEAALVEADQPEYFPEAETPEQIELRRQLEQARTFHRNGQWREAAALCSQVHARAEGDIKESATDLLDQVRRQLNSTFEKSMADGMRARSNGDIEEARKQYEIAQRLKPEEDLPRRGLLDLGGELATRITIAVISKLRSGLKERKDIRILGNAVYEAEALDGEGKLKGELSSLLAEARTEYDKTRRLQGAETTQMRFGDLEARSDAVAKIRDRVATGEKLIYDATTNTERAAFELLQEAVKLLENASADAAQYELDLAEKQKATHPRYAKQRLELALEQPFSEDYKRLLQQKLVEVESLVKVQEKSENLQEQAKNEADPVKGYSLVLQAKLTFAYTPGIAEQVAQKRQTALNSLVVRLESLRRDAEIDLGSALKSGQFHETRTILKQGEEAAAEWPEETKPAEINALLEIIIGVREKVVELEKNWNEYNELANAIREQVLDSNRRSGALDLFHKLNENQRFKIFPDLAILTSEIDNYTDVGEKLVAAEAARAEGDFARVFDLADKAIKSQKAGRLAGQFSSLYDQASIELSINRARALLDEDDVPEANNILSAVLYKEKGTQRELDLRQRFDPEQKMIERCIADSPPMQAQYDRASGLVGMQDSALMKAYVNPAFALRQARVKADGDVSNPKMRSLINSFKEGEARQDPAPEELSKKAAAVLRQDLADKGISERLEALRLFRYVGGDRVHASESEKETWRLSLRTAEARRAGRLLSESLRQDVLPVLIKLYQDREEQPISDSSLLRLAENARGLREAELLETDAEKDIGRWFEIEWGRRQSCEHEESGDFAGAVRIYANLMTLHPTLEVQSDFRRLRIQQKVELARDHVMNHHDGDQAVIILQELKGEVGIGSSYEVEVALADAYAIQKNFPSAFGSLEEAFRFAPKEKNIQSGLQKKRKELERERQIQGTLESIEKVGTPLEKLKLLQEALNQPLTKDSRRLNENREKIFKEASNNLLSTARQSQATGSDEGKLKAVIALVDLQGLEKVAGIAETRRHAGKELSRLRSDLASVAEAVIRSAQEFEPATMTLEQAISRDSELSSRLQIFDNVLPLFGTELEQAKERLQKHRRVTAKLLENLMSLQIILLEVMKPELWEEAIRNGEFQMLEIFALQISGLNLQSMHEVQDLEKCLYEWKEIRNYILKEIAIVQKKFSPDEAFEEVGILLTRLVSAPTVRPDGQTWEKMNQSEYEKIHGWMNDYLRVNDLFTQGELVGWVEVGKAARQRQIELTSWVTWDKECRLRMERLASAGAVTAAHTPATELLIKQRDFEKQATLAQSAIDLQVTGPLTDDGQWIEIHSQKAKNIRSENMKQQGSAERALREAKQALEELERDPNIHFPDSREFNDAVAKKDWDQLERLLARARAAGAMDDQKQKQVGVFARVLQDARQPKKGSRILDKLKGNK